MTSNGLNGAINNWLKAYEPYFNGIIAAKAAEEE